MRTLTIYSLHLTYMALALCSYTCLAAKKKSEPITKQEYDTGIYNWTSTFAEVLQLTGKKHYQLKQPESCMSKAIDAFLTQLDPHSSFLPPDKYKKILEATTGEFFGVGIIIDNTRKNSDKFLTVVDVIPEGPAATAGLKPGDKIIDIDNKPIEDMSTDEATSHLKGERASICTVKVVREGYPDMLTFKIKRDVVKEQHSHAFYCKEYNVYYVSLTQFSENAIQQIKNLLTKENNVPYKGLILDLRNNSGGLLTAAVDVASFFVDKGSLVTTTKDRSGAPIEKYHTASAPIAKSTIPIFILINNYTASAAEILAGVLKYYSEKASHEAEKSKKNQEKLMVFLVGQKTFGKGSVQDVIPLHNNCAVKLTTALYYLPNDQSVQGTGIEPDFSVPRCFPPPEQLNWFVTYFGREENLSNHIQNGNESSKKQKAASKAEEKKNATLTEQAQKQLQQDSQFKMALSFINLFSLAKQVCPQEVCTRTTANNFIKKMYPLGTSLDLKEVK